MLGLTIATMRPVWAVPPGQVSWTAKAVCEYRAIAAAHPDPKMRNGDGLADRYCAPFRLPRDYEAAREGTVRESSMPKCGEPSMHL